MHVTIDKTWKQTKHPSTDDWIKKACTYAFTMEYHSATKKNEMLTCNTGWTEGILLSEINHTEKDKY